LTALGDGGQKQHVSVRGRIYDHLGADVAIGPRPIFGNKGLPKPLGEPLTDQARGDVDPAARGKTGYDVHRPSWKDLRPCDPGGGRERGSAGCQVQELAAGKFHAVPNESGLCW
jgi:hypothetical protein